MIEKYPGRLTLGLDARDGRVATGGWLDVSEVDATTLALQFDDLPLAERHLYRHRPGRDARRAEPGNHRSPGLAALKTPVTASGGVGGLEDLARAGRPCRSSRLSSSGGPCTKGVSGSARRRERAGDRSTAP